MSVFNEGSQQSKELKEDEVRRTTSMRLDRTRTLAGGRPLSLQNKQKSTAYAMLSFGADYGARTRHLHLGKVALYQMS